MATTKKAPTKKGGKPSKRWVPPPPKKKTTTRQKPKKASKAMTDTSRGEEAIKYRQQQTATGQHPSSVPGGKPVDKDKDDDKDKEGDRGGKTDKSKKGDSDDPAAEGDPEKGKIDPDDPDKRIAMKDRRAYLEDQALKNQQANDELNAMQEQQNEKFRQAQLKNSIVIDPDKQREESMESARAALKMHDPDEIKKQAEARKKAATEASGRSFGSPNTPDFRQGQVVG